jgi:hypothetical protein
MPAMSAMPAMPAFGCGSAALSLCVRLLAQKFLDPFKLLACVRVRLFSLL